MTRNDNREPSAQQPQPKKKLVLNAETLKKLQQVTGEEPEGWFAPTNPPGCT